MEGERQEDRQLPGWLMQFDADANVLLAPWLAPWLVHWLLGCGGWLLPTFSSSCLHRIPASAQRATRPLASLSRPLSLLPHRSQCVWGTIPPSLSPPHFFIRCPCAASSSVSSLPPPPPPPPPAPSLVARCRFLRSLGRLSPSLTSSCLLSHPPFEIDTFKRDALQVPTGARHRQRGRERDAAAAAA